MSFTFAFNANLLNSCLLGVLNDQRPSTFHGVIFVVIILGFLGCWLLLDVVRNIRARSLDRKELVRRRRMDQSTYFVRRGEKSAKILRRDLVIVGAVAFCILFLVSKELHYGDGLASVVMSDSSAKNADVENVENNALTETEYRLALMGLQEELAKNTAKIDALTLKNELVYSLIEQNFDSRNNIALVSKTSAQDRESNDAQQISGTSSNDVDTEDSERAAEEEFESHGGTIAYIPSVSAVPMTSVGSSSTVRPRVAESVSDITPEKGFEGYESVVASDLSKSAYAPNELRVREPLLASLLDDAFFQEKILADSKVSLAKEFNSFVNDRSFAASNNTHISQTNGEFSRAYSPNANLIDSTVSSNAVFTGRAEGKSLLEQIDEECNRISSIVKSCVLPTIVVKRSSRSQQIEEETGCSFLLMYDGKVWAITNYHVVKEAASNESIKLHLPSKEIVNPIGVRFSEEFDIALMELDTKTIGKDSGLAFCKFGDSDELQVTNAIYTYGSPFGLEKTVTSGHVSSLRRCNKDLVASSKDLLPEYIQIDAAINPGNSGGPLYNVRGEVVGVVTAIASTSGVNEGVAFAIPSNILLRIVKTLAEKGEWKRSRLGVELTRVSGADLAATKISDVFGAKVRKVQPGAPGYRAGLREGDVILAYNGQAVEDDVHLARLIALNVPQEKARLSVVRGDHFFEMEVTPVASLTQNSTRR